MVKLIIEKTKIKYYYIFQVFYKKPVFYYKVNQKCKSVKNQFIGYVSYTRSIEIQVQTLSLTNEFD